MQFLKHYTLKYTPLSPVHIGADESYEPGNYVIDDENHALYSFDTQAAMNGLEESDHRQLLSIVSGRPDDEMLTRVQAFFNNNRDKLIGMAHQPVLTARGIAALYHKRIGKTAQHEGRGRRVINKLEIERTFYNPVDNSPLFPGSSIKGAIRTALLDMENNGNRPRGRPNNQQFQADIFKGKFATDPMRLISVSDASWQGSRQLPDTQVLFAVNRKREPVMKDGKLLKSQAERSNLNQLLECVPAMAGNLLQGSLQIQDVSGIRHDDSKLPNRKLQWDISDIAQACNAFYFDLFAKERKNLEDRGYVQREWWVKMDQLLQQGMLKKMQGGKAFLLRVGRHSGAEGVTLNGARKKNIKIMQGKGNKPVWENKPRTWWLAAEQISDTNSLLPFGWVLVEIDPVERHETEIDMEVADWFSRQLQKQKKLSFVAEQRQKQAEERRKQERLEEQRIRDEEEAERQRIANLSPLEKDLEELLENVPPQEHDTRLLRELESGRWQGDDARQVAERVKSLMQAANKWLPEFAGSNKKKLKFKERSLKVQEYLE